MTMPLGTDPADCMRSKEAQNYVSTSAWIEHESIDRMHLLEVGSFVVHRLQRAFDHLARFWTDDLKDIKMLSQVCNLDFCNSSGLLRTVQCKRSR